MRNVLCRLVEVLGILVSVDTLHEVAVDAIQTLADVGP